MTTLKHSPPETLPDAYSSNDQPVQKSFSCVLCAQRKVKCDRLHGGCLNCTKARVSCIYKAPPPLRRRKRGGRDVDVTTRLRLYEEALRRLGVNPEDLIRQGAQHTVPEVHGSQGRVHDAHDEIYTVPDAGILVTEENKSRYLENGIWTSLQNEFRDSKEILDDSTDEDDVEKCDSLPLDHCSPTGTGLLFGIQTSATALRSLHPTPVQILKLWQTYFDNVNPLVKLFHAPTVQRLVSGAISDLDDIPRNLETLLFGIYAVSVESLTDSECVSLLGESKFIAVQRFRTGAQCALANANLLTSSDIMVLQAFVLFILSQQGYDARVVWIWTGIAQRLGQRIGLHRDGTKLGLPPFDIEMRRRLWWQIMMLEGYTQKLAGTGSNGIILMGDVDMPLNVNDRDLSPAMKHAPHEHPGPTEMMFFLMRCHVADFLKRSANANTTFDGLWNKMTTIGVDIGTKDKLIDELEAMIQHKFLRYCDTSIPWHSMCSQLGKAIIYMMRFMAHSTGYYSTDIAQSTKDMLFDLALYVITSQNMAYTMKEMRGFIWHINLQFQWKAFVFVVSELRYRTQGDGVRQAWEQVEKAFENHPSFEKRLARRALPVAVGNLTLKAWEEYAAAQGILRMAEPGFVKNIRCRREQTKSPSRRADTTKQSSANAHGMQDGVGPRTFDGNTVDWSNTMETTFEIPEPRSVPLDVPENVDWATWDSLFVDFNTGAQDGVMDLSMFDLGVQ